MLLCHGPVLADNVSLAPSVCCLLIDDAEYISKTSLQCGLAICSDLWSAKALLSMKASKKCLLSGTACVWRNAAKHLCTNIVLWHPQYEGLHLPGLNDEPQFSAGIQAHHGSHGQGAL